MLHFSIVTFEGPVIKLIPLSPLQLIFKFLIVTVRVPLTLIARPAVDVSVLLLPSKIIDLSINKMSLYVKSLTNVTVSPSSAAAIASSTVK